MAGELFKKYYSRLAKEGIIKSILCGLIVGFSALFVSSAILWLTNTKLFWISLLVCAVVTATTAPIFYYKKFKPTTKAIARRVDDLGLEERVLTMTELENDDSYIAMRQREDTVKALQTVNAGLLSVIVSVPLIVATCLTGVFGAGMTTVTTLSAAGVMKSGHELIEEALKEPPVYFEIEYEIEGEGAKIVNFETEEELPFQAVEKGKDAIPVLVVVEEGYIFLGWSDGETDPFREDKAVLEDKLLIAEIAKLPEMPDMPGDGDGFPGDLPGDLAGDGEGNNPGPGPGAGGELKPSNQVIDGESYYGDFYDAAFEDVVTIISQNAEMPDALKQLISNYFETIKTSKSDETNGN